MRYSDVIICHIRRDVSFFHSIDDCLDVAGAKRDVIGHGCGTGGVEVDRCRRGAGRRFDTKGRILELQIRFDVKIFSGVIF